MPTVNALSQAPRDPKSGVMNDKARKIGYWVATGLVAFAFVTGGGVDLSGSPQVLEGMTHLGYPPYFATILGVWKVLGAVALLAPRFPRLKEWAYAGMFFDLTGAACSHAASGDPAGKVITPLVLLAVVAASWALRPEGRKLAGEPKREADARVPRAAVAT
jgi:MYXO-CTERM domain-containing protein